VKLVFDDRALADLEGIHDWIAWDNPAAAKAVVERIFSSIEHLATFPQLGHAGRDEGSFEWVIPRLPYIAVYEIHAGRDEIVVVAVVHGARERINEDS
jgi:plasmid stabilization system protein ParE